MCNLQALYDGTSGAREIPELPLCIDSETAHDNSVYTVISTYEGSSEGLDVHTVHSRRSTNPNRYCNYRLTQFRDWELTDSTDAFRQGATALRNARD